MSGTVVRIAMWSGPRNISTALMRSFASRPDTAVTDEPLYAHYLRHTGLPHPGAAEVIARHDPDWRSVAAYLTGPVPGGKAVWYQKHMAHHLLAHIDRVWLASLRHAFLIRDPGEMLTSLIRVTPNPTLADTGLEQQWELFSSECDRGGGAPPVVDSRDVLEAPAATLRLLCGALGIDYTPAMLSWPKGRQATDGVWAPHWYSSVEASTGFEKYVAKSEAVPARLTGLLEECRKVYERLREHRLAPGA